MFILPFFTCKIHSKILNTNIKIIELKILPLFSTNMNFKILNTVANISYASFLIFLNNAG
jgi:hypothetical protein